MKIWLFVFASAALAVTGCSSTTTASRGGGEQQVAAANVSGDDGPDLICRRIKKTGTRFTQKVCMTREQYEEQQEREGLGGAHAVREWQRRGKMANDSGGNGI